MGVGVQVPLVLPNSRSLRGVANILEPFVIMKKSKKKFRNAATIPAKTRKAGVMKNKKDKRKNGKNKQKEFLSEEF